MKVPDSFISRFKPILGDDFEEFMESNSKPLRKSFRINSLKVKSKEEREKIVDSIKAKNLKLSKVPWNEDSYFVEFEEDNRYDLGNLYEHFLGHIYVQEATSMIPPLVMELENLKEGSMVLDMAASPGSKTTQIVELTKDKCLVVANELDFMRMAPLKMNLERLGAKNIVITNEDASRISNDVLFDRILLDAPCTGSGIIRKSPKTMDRYNPRKIIGMSNLQKSIFKNAVELLKKDGVLVYSTCSIDPEENEFLVMWALKKYPELTLEKIEINGLKLSHNVKSFEGVDVPEEVYSKVLRIWPHDNDTGGFFVSKFRKR